MRRKRRSTAIIDQIKQVIASGKGNGRQGRQVGHAQAGLPRVQKYNEGVLRAGAVQRAAGAGEEVERRMRVTDLVIKFITVRIDEKLKKIDKRKKASREARGAQARAAGGGSACSGGARSGSAGAHAGARGRRIPYRGPASAEAATSTAGASANTAGEERRR